MRRLLQNLDRGVHQAATSARQNNQVKFVLLLELLEEHLKLVKIAINAIQARLLERARHFICEFFVGV